MTTKMKRQGSATELPRFAVGALAIAGASAANAATVQITFNNSFLSTSTGAATLDTDFGDDGDADLDLLRQRDYVAIAAQFVRVMTASGRNFGTVDGSRRFAAVKGVWGSVGGYGSWTRSQRVLVQVTFSDTNIRGGSSTTGYLDVNGIATQPGEKRITVNRLIFDDISGGAIAGLNVSNAAFPEYVASAVPEPSGLGLLALGAGGLLARRRRSQAA